MYFKYKLFNHLILLSRFSERTFFTIQKDFISLFLFSKRKNSVMIILEKDLKAVATAETKAEAVVVIWLLERCMDKQLERVLGF